MLVSSLVVSGVLAAAPAPLPQDTPPRSIPVPRRALPADTAFVLHLDLRTFFASSWWRALGPIEEVARALDEIEQLEMLREQIGLDPFRDLLAVTILGRDDQGDGAAVILRATAAADRAIDAARGFDAHNGQSVGDLYLDSWTMDGGGLVASFHATPEGDRLAILGEKGRDVSRVVRAATGGQPRLSDSATPAIEARAREGAFFYLEVGLPLDTLLADTPIAGAARDVKRLQIQLGESNGRVFVAAAVEAADGRNARKLADLLNGARSILTMSGMLEQLPAAAQELYAGIDAEVDGATVRLGVEMSARDLAYMLEELRELAN